MRHQRARMMVAIRHLLMNRLTVAALVAVLFAIATAWRQPVVSHDTTFYLSLADAIEQRNLDPVLTTTRATWTVITLPTLLAIARSLAPEHWAYIMVGMNVVCGAITAALLVGVAAKVTRSTTASAAALVFYVGAYDVVAWLPYILTDMLYSALALAVFSVAIGGIVDDSAPARRRITLAVLLVISFITRPAGAILIPLSLTAEYVRSRLGHEHLTSVGRRLAPALVALAGLALSALVIRAYFYDDLRRWPTDFMRPKLEELVARENKGEVVWDRRETWHEPPDSVSDHLMIELDRFLRFFQFTSSGFSRTHNLVNTVYFGALYGLGVVGVVRGFRGGDRRRQAILLTTLLWIGGSAWLHALTFLDYDWRYRLPVMPEFILLAACGVEALAPAPNPDRADTAAARPVGNTRRG